MKLSYSTWGMPHVPIEVAVEHCATLGFDGLELAVIPGWSTNAAGLDAAARRRIRSLYDQHGLDLCGLSGNVSLLADADGAQRDAIEHFRSYLELAAELQHPGQQLIVTTTSAGRSEEWNDRRQELADILGSLALHAASLGVGVGIEPHVGTALRTPDDVLWVVREVNHPALTIHFDISHFNVQGLHMDEVVATLAPHSAHTHVKDERGIAPAHEFLIPGEGEMDYVRYLEAMLKAGYNGHIVVEVSLMVQARPDYDPLSAAAHSYRVLAKAFEDARIPRT
ncbi:MAG: sugar phosphate isomerase/epimerase family protein [Thermomicrobiales bacterium]